MVDGSREADLLFPSKWLPLQRRMLAASPSATVLSSLNYEADAGSKYVVDLMREHWNAC
jgi:hypothetical protein